MSDKNNSVREEASIVGTTTAIFSTN